MNNLTAIGRSPFNTFLGISPRETLSFGVMIVNISFWYPAIFLRMPLRNRVGSRLGMLAMPFSLLLEKRRRICMEKEGEKRSGRRGEHACVPPPISTQSKSEKNESLIFILTSKTLQTRRLFRMQSTAEQIPSRLTVLIGQGGIQTFQSLEDRLTIDTESKTNPNVKVTSNGTGGLWEKGYHCSTSLIFDAVRRLLEKMDRYEGMYVGHATAGGTGSGLTIRCIEETRDWLPKSYLIGMAIFPHEGETPLQHYNSVFNLAHLHMHADATLLFPNEHLALDAACSPEASKDMSAWACHMVQPLMQMSRGAWDLLTHVCPMPDFRLLHLARSGTHASDWLSIVRDVCKHTWASKSRPSCLSATAYLPFVFQHEDLQILYSKVNRRLGFLDVCDHPLRCHIVAQPTKVERRGSYLKNAGDAQVSLIHNTASLAVRRLSPLLAIATQQYQVSAYKHYFSHDGWSVLRDACQVLREVTGQYQECGTLAPHAH